MPGTPGIVEAGGQDSAAPVKRAVHVAERAIDPNVARRTTPTGCAPGKPSQGPERPPAVPALTVNMRLCNPVVQGPSEQHTQQTHVPAVRRRKEQRCEGVRRARSCARREWQPARHLHGTASLKLRKTISSH